MTTLPRSGSSTSRKRFPGVLALDDVTLRDRRRVVPRAVRRERRGQEHARKDPRRHPRRRRRPRRRLRRRRSASRARATRSPPASAWCTRSSRSARTCRSPRTSVSGRCRRRAGSSSRARCGARATAMLAAIGAHDRRRPPRRRADDRPAADAADRGRGRQRRAHHRLRRADEQPVAARGRAALRADRPAARSAASRCIYVTHRMAEIFRLCDTVTVLRDGRTSRTQPAAELTEAALVQMMIGRPLEEYFPSHVHAHAGRRAAARRGPVEPGQLPATSRSRCAPARSSGSRGWSARADPRSRSALFGLDPRGDGQRLVVRGSRSASRSPATRCAPGIGLVPEDRKRQGLVLSMTRARQHDAADARGAVAAGRSSGAAPSAALARTYFERLRVRAPALDASPPASRAATSRSSCSRSGSRRSAAS